MTLMSHYHDPDYTFANSFATLRTALGLTQAELAQQLGVTDRAIQRWEAGTRSPKAEYLKALLALCIEQHVFPPGRAVEQARTLWKAAHLKVLFDEDWVRGLLSEQTSSIASQISDEAWTPQSIARRIDWGEEGSTVSFYGRESEQAQLISWIQEEHCRLIALLGLGGIGKSALAVTLLHLLAPSFSVAVFRSVRDAIPCEELVADLIQALAPEPIGQLPFTLDRRIALLLQLLQTHRCFIVLDNVETLLQEGEQSGHYRVGYEGYARLIESIGALQHQSCLLLTSREKPAEFKPLEGSRTPVRSLHLSGLDEKAGEQILQEKQLRGEAEAQRRLIQAYSGNPLALKIVAETIRDLFASDIAAFLGEGQIIFQGIRALLAQQFTRLTFLEQSVLFWLAILREPVDVNSLLGYFVAPVPRLHLLEALEDLRRRSLVEHGQQHSLFTLQSVVMEFVTDTLVKQMASEIQQRESDTLLTYALSLASAKEYIRQTQERLLLAPVLFHLGATQFRKGVVEQQLLHYLDLLRSLDLDIHGYGPTNIAMLLRHLNGHLKGINLSGCGLREASLQVQMHNARLVGATVRDSIFTEPLGPSTAVAISRNGQYWAAADPDGDVRVWEWGQEAKQTLHLAWHAHVTNIFALAFSPDGRTLASGGWDNAVKLWEVEHGTLLWTGWHTGQVNDIAFAPDGYRLASGGDDGLIRVWDTRSGAQVQQLASQGAPVHSLDWSSDGRMLASGYADGSIWIWKPELPEPDIHARLSEHVAWVTGLAFSPDSTQLASTGHDGTVKLWKVESGSCFQTFFGHAARVARVAWSPDGRTVASGGWDGTIFLWDILQGRARASLRAAGISTLIASIAFTPDSRTLLSGSNFLQMWDVEHGQCLRTIDSYLDIFTSIDWSPDGQFIASGSARQVTIWEVAPVPSQSTLRGHRETVQGVAWSPDGLLVASAGNDGRVGLWNPNTGVCLEMLQDPDAVDTLFLSVAWSSDGRLLACGSFMRGVQVWDIPAHTRRWVGQTPQPTRIHSVAWSPDGTQVVGAGWDGSLYLWDARDGILLRQMKGHTWGVMSVVWSPDGKWLASAGGGREYGELIVWQTQSGAPVRILAEHPWATFAVAWSPDGKRLVSGGSDGMLCWWEAGSGHRLWARKAHQGMVYALKVSPDGHRLASCGEDGAILLWNLESGEHLQTVRLERPYERLDITGIRGINQAQKTTLRALGAIGD